ncbi:TonB-dependent receptor [Aliifodinibius sp. S!AR15-10]|uniref:TonB-dependent receptor n=1 Tax=Aliifodinibius sp. S!AR15-10 TaxID=2950437 RepID=UPI002860EB97|nr:TonB-dependent receptor [Aliifodinibius sp. S!AR15-10]MDR8390361.1 TonB-dependent receptor [Aliifodinibius sp. S!AR15-10]
MRIRDGIFLAILFILLFAGRAMGQDANNPGADRYTLIFQGIPIEQALKDLVETTKIDLIYNPNLLRDQQVFSISKQKKPEEVLSDILNGTKLDYVLLSSGTFLIIESANTPSKYGSFAGTVYDKSTGEPLDGANVLIADASTGTSTNRSGRFSIAPLLSGQYEVTITYVGYQAIRDTVWIPMQSSNPQNFYLEARPVFIEPLIVSSIQPRLPYYGASGEEVTDLTGSRGSYTGTPDAIRSINAVMGTNFSLSVADLHLQGGAAGDHKVLLDGTPVYNPVSLGRLTGAFSPYALEKITIHKAGFGVEVGSQLSGIIEVKQDLADHSENTITAQADPLNVNARIDLATDLSEQVTLKTMVAGRSNIWQWYQKPSLDGTLEQWDRLDPLLIENLLENTSVASNFRALFHDSDIRFYDLHMKNELRFNEFHSTSLSLYQGKNYLQTQLLSHNDNAESDVPDFMYTQDGYDWLNTVGTLQHDWLISSRLNASFKTSLTSHRSTHHFAMANSDELNTVPANPDQALARLRDAVDGQAHSGDQNKLTEASVEARFDYSLHRHHTLDFGLESKFVDYAFSLSDPFYHPTSTAGRQFMLSGFLDDEIALGYQTNFKAGTRFTYIPSIRQLFAEPRLSLQYDTPETSLGYFSAKISTGIYRQFINQFDVTSVGPSAIVPSNRFWVPADYSTDVPKAYHINSELLLEPTEHLALRWEGYYKWHPKILALDYHALLQTPDSPTDHFEDQNNFIVTGKSYTYGTGLSISQFFESLQAEMTLSYQYMLAKQRIPNRFDDNYVETPWNHPHKLSAGLNWNITGGLTTTVRWQSIWGRAWAFKRAYYDYLTIHQNQSKFGPYNVTSPSDDTLSPFHQLDLGLSYGHSFGESSMRIQVDLINLLNRKNVLENQIVPQPTTGTGTEYGIQERKLPGFTPSVSIELFF